MNNETCRICTLRAADGGARLFVEVETTTAEGSTRQTLSLLAARLSHLPQVGVISPETASELRHEDAVCAALGAGLRCLGSCACSAKHLTEKLRVRGYAADVAGEAVAELAAKGYLKENEGALREAERGLAKLWGDRRILADLAAKGYTGGALKYAAARLKTEDGAARCAALMRKRRMAVPLDVVAAKKLFASLARYGYTPAEIRKAMQK